jgi:putative phage-type endonuclease
MPITDRQREQRRRHIGASDVAVLLGLSQWRTPYELWLEKTGQLMPDAETSPAAEIGNAMEASVLRWGAEQLGVSIRRNVRRVRGCMAANLDAMVVGRPWALEAKTSGIMHPAAARDQWGPEGTGEVPPHVAAQALAQMWVADLELVAIPALIGGRGLVMYRLERDQRTAPLCENIAERCAAWWERHIIGGEPPPVGERAPDPRVLLYANPLDGSEVELPAGDEWAAFMAAREARKSAAATLRTLEKAEDDAEARWLITMGTATRAIVGGHLCRVKEVNRAGYTVEPKTYRQLDVRPIKEPKQ